MRPGEVRLGMVGQCPAWSGAAWFAKVGFGLESADWLVQSAASWHGAVWLGKIGLGQVRPGAVWLGMGWPVQALLW